MVIAADRAAAARDLACDLDWFAAVADARFRRHFHPDSSAKEVPPPPPLDRGASGYARFVLDHAPDPARRTALVLALAHALRPRLLDVFLIRNTAIDRRFTEFGGAVGRGEGGFDPTGETLAFLLGGDDLQVRLSTIALLAPDGDLARGDVVRAEAADDPLRGALRLGRGVPVRMGLADEGAAPLGPGFPAQRIGTGHRWADLVLHPATRAGVAEIAAWIEHGPTLMNDWGMARTLRPGHRSLFHGPPGTGKTMTAALLGGSTGRPVYRVDLSLTVSKYIGETEKNLARVIDEAEARGWILFFDEADALFGKRGETRDANDRHANGEVAFLLQRIEVFGGIAILASNYRDNIDEAFARRFETVVHFPAPRAEERLELWRRALPARAPLAADVDLHAIARDHALTGGAIANAVRFAALASVAGGERPIAQAHLLEAIRREQAKEGRGA